MALADFAHSSPDTMQRASVNESGVTSDTKYTKAEVNYRDAGSSNTRCERCVNFSWAAGARGRGVCRIVMGVIDAGAVCDKFQSGGSGLQDLVTGKPTQ